MAGTLAKYKRPFTVAGLPCVVLVGAKMDGLHSELLVDGRSAASDHTPATGEDAIRNHRLAATLPDGSAIEVEAGYINWLNVGIAVRHDGALVHESHPGRRIAYPARAAEMARNARPDPGIDLSRYRANRVPILVDILLGFLFFAVAKLTDLSTAALVGAGAGIALVVAQRFVKVDLVGGLALFGVFMLLVSAGLALAFQDDMAVKMRSTIVGLLGAVLFLGDGLLGGNRLGKGMARYLPYSDIDPARLGIGVGLTGLVMAALNWLVARSVSTDAWLFYTTFVDIILLAVLFMFVFRYARRPDRNNAA